MAKNVSHLQKYKYLFEQHPEKENYVHLVRFRDSFCFPIFSRILHRKTERNILLSNAGIVGDALERFYIPQPQFINNSVCII